MSRPANIRVRHTVVGVLGLAYLPLFASLLEQSSSNPYAGHVTIVPILAAVLLWVDRRHLRDSRNGDPTTSVALAAVAALLLATGYGSGDIVLQIWSFVAAIAAVLWWLCGPPGIRRAAFVLGFLALMIPPSRNVFVTIASGLQHVVAVVVAIIAHVVQVPAQQEGVFLRLPGLTLEVAEECSGLRFLLILLVCVTAFARLALPTISGQLVLIALSVPVAVLANIMRVAATTLAAYALGSHVATGPSHYYIGKAFWAAAVLVMITMAMFIRARTNAATRNDGCAAQPLSDLCLRAEPSAPTGASL